MAVRRAEETRVEHPHRGAGLRTSLFVPLLLLAAACGATSRVETEPPPAAAAVAAKPPTPAALPARVTGALGAQRSFSAAGITIETYEGRVHLSGFVPIPEMASRAGRVTAGVSGVRSVHNDIAVK